MREVGKCEKLPAPFQGGTYHEASEGSARGVGKPRSRSVLPVGWRRERPASADLSAGRQARERAGAVVGSGVVREAREFGRMGLVGQVQDVKLRKRRDGRES